MINDVSSVSANDKILRTRSAATNKIDNEKWFLDLIDTHIDIDTAMKMQYSHMKCHKLKQIELKPKSLGQFWIEFNRMDRRDV